MIGDAFRDLCNIEGIGINMADDLINFIGEPRNLAVIEDLTNQLNVEATTNSYSGFSKINGKTIVFISSF